MHDRKMAGIVSIGDLVKFRLKDAERRNRCTAEVFRGVPGPDVTAPINSLEC